MNRLRLSVVVLTCSCAGSRPDLLPVPAAGSAAIAEVQAAGLVVLFPSEPRGDTGWSSLKVSNRYAGYSWLVTVRTAKRPLSAALVVDPDHDLQVPAFQNLRAVVAAGELRSCMRDVHIISCAYALDGQAWAQGDHVVIAITDKEWRATLAAAHPDSIQLARLQENTKYDLSIAVPLRYR